MGHRCCHSLSSLSLVQLLTISQVKICSGGQHGSARSVPPWSSTVLYRLFKLTCILERIFLLLSNFLGNRVYLKDIYCFEHTWTPSGEDVLEVQLCGEEFFQLPENFHNAKMHFCFIFGGLSLSQEKQGMAPAGLGKYRVKSLLALKVELTKLVTEK